MTSLKAKNGEDGRRLAKHLDPVLQQYRQFGSARRRP
jgi:hypothetical protein